MTKFYLKENNYHLSLFNYAIIMIMQVHSTSSTTGTIYADAFKRSGKGDEVQNDPQLQKLRSIDTAVRAHEAAHLAAGGGVVRGGANFSYERGSDGKMYAVSGEVPIDTSKGSTPQESIQKAREIIAAALAPANPSGTDHQVAMAAATMEVKAQMELVKERQAQLNAERAYGEAAIGSESAAR